MAHCEHLGILQVVTGKQATIRDEGRLDRIISELDSPTVQYPSLLFFIGRKLKDQALHELFPYNSIKRGIRDGVASLRVDTSTLASKHPIIFADSDSESKCFTQGETPKCHATTLHPVNWSLPFNRKIWDVLHARLFFPFTDVICIFADEMGGLQNVASRLNEWASIGSPLSVPRKLRPRVVVVAFEGKSSTTHNVLEIEDLRFTLKESSSDISGRFSEISLLHLSKDLSPLARHRPLKDVLLRHADEMRRIRQDHHWLFNAEHFAALFHEALIHTTRTLYQPFDAIRASRVLNPPSGAFLGHLVAFLELADKVKMPYNSTASVIASSFLVDAYPPRMHVFDPNQVFKTIYQPVCLKALAKVYGPDHSQDYRCELIENYMTSMFVNMEMHHGTVTDLHQRHLQSLRQWWALIASNRTCLSCLNQNPEHVFSCGHSICDICVKRFGTELPAYEYRFRIDSCVLCSAGSLLAMIKPPCSGVSILSIDGGGVRGVIPLEFLDRLQKVLGPECLIQDLFDMAFGTSSGGLIVLSLFLQCWSISRCITVFDTLTQKLFAHSKKLSQGLTTRVRSMLRVWLSDSYYNVQDLEECLKDTFGTQRRLFGSLKVVSGVKVAVTASTISDAACFLLSNYNGPGMRDKNCGYKHVRPQDTNDEPYIWQAGRATSAAPVLFKPAKIENVGTFQDGGLSHNNPVHLAVWESREMWPELTQPDLVLSLGTGSGVLKSPKAPNFTNIWQDGFVPRLYRSLMTNMDGQGAWQNLVNHLDDKSRPDYVRLNVSLEDKQLTIDDASQKQNLRVSVHLQSPSHHDHLKIIFDLLVSRFFFELDAMPERTDSGLYNCQGTIRCRLPGLIMAGVLISVSPGTYSFVKDDDRLGMIDWSMDVCRLCHRYRKKVSFFVRDMDDPILLSLKGSKHMRRLSGFPHPLTWFVEQQGLNAVFGTADHGVPGKLPCHLCCSLFRRKRVLGEAGVERVAKRVKY